MPWAKIHGLANNYGDVVQYTDSIDPNKILCTKNVYIGYVTLITSWNNDKCITVKVIGKGVQTFVRHVWLDLDEESSYSSSPLCDITQFLKEIREFPNIATKRYFNQVVKEELMARVHNPDTERGRWLYEDFFKD